MALALLLGLGLVGTTMAGCVGGSDGAGPVIHCNCTPPSTCHYNGFPMPIVRGDVVPHPDLPCPPCGHDTCACPLPPPAPPPPLPPPAPRGQCVVQNNTVFNDGNLYGNGTCLAPHCDKFPNHTKSQDDCCQMCHETAGCVFWTFTPGGCYGEKSIGCCWLKDYEAWLGRAQAQGGTGSWTSGSTHLFPPPPVVPPPAPPAPDPSTTFNFLAIADWGSSTATRMDPSQKKIADGMAAVAEEINATQVFCLGDNFYGVAVDGPGDARFKGTFEDVYDAPSLKGIPFWAIAGNHDWGGNVSQQIAYHHSPQNGPPLKDGLGGRWRYPDFWYNVTQTVSIPKSGGKTATLEVLLFDSEIGLGKLNGTMEENVSLHELSGHPELRGLPFPPEDRDKMFQWVATRMAASTADYLWVGSHYPVYSIGGHGPTADLIVKLKPLLEKYGANYFNGHDHNLQHIRENNSVVNYITTGAGMQCCYPDDALYRVPPGSVRFAMVSGPMDGPTGSGYQPMPFGMTGGFTSYRIGAGSMEVVFHAHNGTVLYTTPKIMPRDLTK